MRSEFFFFFFSSFFSSFFFSLNRMVWSCYQEIAAILISFQRHAEWQSREVKVRPRSGSMLLYSRKKVRYRRDGYCWKKRKDGKTTREDHMKLKVVFHFHGKWKSRKVEECLQSVFVRSGCTGAGGRVHLRLLRALGDPSDVSSAMLLATTESRRRPRSLPKRSLPGRWCKASGAATVSRTAARQEGVDAWRAGLSA